MRQPSTNVVLWASLLAVSTFGFLGFVASHLPYSSARDRITDTLATPGALISALIYPQGIHTGNGAPLWGIVVIVSNLVVYGLFWYGCLRLLKYVLARGRQHGPSRRGIP